MRHGLAGLADMNRASLHTLTDAVAALSRARIMATGVQRAQPVEPWHKLMFARVVDKHGNSGRGSSTGAAGAPVALLLLAMRLE